MSAVPPSPPPSGSSHTPSGNKLPGQISVNGVNYEIYVVEGSTESSSIKNAQTFVRQMISGVAGGAPQRLDVTYRDPKQGEIRMTVIQVRGTSMQPKKSLSSLPIDIQATIMEFAEEYKHFEKGSKQREEYFEKKLRKIPEEVKEHYIIHCRLNPEQLSYEDLYQGIISELANHWTMRERGSAYRGPQFQHVMQNLDLLVENKVVFPDILMTAVRLNWPALQHVPEAFQLAHPEIVRGAVRENGAALQHVPEAFQLAHPEIVKEAIQQDRSAIQFVSPEFRRQYPDIMNENP